MVKVKFYENGELGSLNVLINKDKQFMFDATNLCKTLDIKEDIHFKMEVAEWTMRVLEMNKEEKLSLVKPIMKQVGL